MHALQQRRVALVTGGSRGIGRAVVERLAADGHDVAFAYREREDAAAQVAAAAEAVGARALAIQADIARAEDLAKLVGLTGREFGRIDALVMCAAAIPEGPVLELPEEEFDRAFDVNVKAAYRTIRLAAPLLSEGGRIVTISSAVTGHISPTMHAYAASKAALEVLTRQVAGELGPRGITANVVVPGPTRTDGLVLPEGAAELLLAQTPLGRFGEPSDIASVVAFLVGEDAGWITGQRIHATGGLT